MLSAETIAEINTETRFFEHIDISLLSPADIRLHDFCTRNLLVQERVTAYYASPARMEELDYEPYVPGLIKPRWMHELAAGKAIADIYDEMRGESLDWPPEDDLPTAHNDDVPQHTVDEFIATISRPLVS